MKIKTIMPEVEGFEKLLSFIPKKRFGKFNQYGTSQFGFSRFGDEDICTGKAFFAYALFGDSEFGDGKIWSGIYRTYNVTGKVRCYREPYYITRNPRTPLQQANRQKFANAVHAWQNLTSEQKLLYNERAKGKRLSGYNLFISEYMLSC